MGKHNYEKLASAPTVAVEKTIDEAEKTLRALEHSKPVRGIERFWHTLGPGLTTGAADDDPSGIATYSQAGSQFGFGFLWLAAVTFPLMAIVQEMCARIGLATGRGLATNLRRYFPRWVLLVCALALTAANVFNIGADLGAMAKATQLVAPGVPFGVLVVLFTVVSVVLQIAVPYRLYAKYLKWLSLILLAYVLTAFVIPNLAWGEIFRATIVPHFHASRETFFLLTAVLGTTISPYLFFWQTSQEVEEEITEGKKSLLMRQRVESKAIRKMRIDVWLGMLLSNLVMFFIILVAGATLHAHGMTTIQTAEDAAEALRPLAGNSAFLLFTVGIIGTGLLAVPVLAGSAAYALAESFGWKEGLYRKLGQAQAFYGVIMLATAFGLVLNFVGLDPIRALIVAALVNGLVAPIMLACIVILSGNKEIMHQHTNHPVVHAFGWIITALMAGTGIATIIALLV